MMNKFVFTVAILTASFLPSSINGANGLPNFDFKKASECAANLETMIELTIAAQNLLSSVWTSNKPVCVTYIRPKNGGAWREYHWTERIDDGTNNPVFASKVRIPCLLRDKLELEFRIYHKPATGYANYTTSMMTLKGCASCELADLLNAKKMKLPLKLTPQDAKYMGDVIVYAEKLDGKYDEVTMKLKSNNTESESICGGQLSYFEIYKRIEIEKEKAPENEDDYAMVYRTEPKRLVRKEWSKFSIPLNSLCGGDNKLELKFICLRGNNPMGEFKTSLEEVENYNAEFQLLNKKNKDGGKIFISDYRIHRVPTFSDLMATGLQIRVTIAIDFTRRNSLPFNPESFHYQGADENKFEKAIRLVVTAFEDYVWDQQYDLRAFGAQEVNGKNLHDFKLDKSVNGATGIEGSLQAYRSFLHDTSVQMGPEANIAPMILRLVEEADRRELKKYFVLVVLAAGEIETGEKMEIEAAMDKAYRYTPLSIIFVGIGDADLTNLVKIHQKMLVSYRNNFNFMSIHETDLDSGNNSNAYRRTELLAKLPEQVVSYTDWIKKL